MTTRQIYYTASLIIPDGSDTDSYGEPCEEGRGSIEQDGWIDPDWTLWTVYPKPEDVTPDVWEAPDGDPVAWLDERLRSRLGSVTRGMGETYYSKDSYSRQTDAAMCMIAADVQGFSDDELQRLEEQS